MGCALALSCATAPREQAPPASQGTAATAVDGARVGAGARYPRRPPSCEVALYHTPVPGVPAWDDLGLAEATCHISGSATECLRLLKAEACRLGGDIIYNVPKQPFRPRDQVLLFRGQVAHTRSKPIKKDEDPDLPPPASPEEAAGPIVPLPSGPADVQQ
ncbi:MAG: hypothetical protein ABUS79_18755 [Pseudomonadota bacterium]